MEHLVELLESRWVCAMPKNNFELYDTIYVDSIEITQNGLVYHVQPEDRLEDYAITSLTEEEFSNFERIK